MSTPAPTPSSSIYSDHAANYRENGLPVIPCAAGSKFPGNYSAAHGWRAAYDWQKFCERQPTGYEVSVWDRWPDAGICLPLGAAAGVNGLHLVAVDIDTDVPAEVTAIKSVLPGSPCAKRGAKGETQFYLASSAVVSRPYNDANKRRMLDLLASGRQTVMVPSLHPDLGTPYVWITPDTLDGIDIADLPVLPDDIAERLALALKPFGHEPEAPRLGAAGSAELGIDNPHRSLNDAALANLDAWVPALQLHGCRQYGSKFKAVAHWRPSSSGRPLTKRATNLAISPDGIKDCGENKGYTPLDLVMAACGADLDTAFSWLQARVAPAKPIVLTARAPAEEPAAPPKRGNLTGLGLVLATVDGIAQDWSGLADPETGEIVEEAGATDEIVAHKPLTVVDAALCVPPGLLGDIVQWIIDTDDSPSPQLALGAAIAFLGALAGQRYAHPYKGGRTNFYCVGVAKTGFGKNHARTVITALALASGLMKYMGPARFKSDSGMRKRLERSPAFCSLMDEIGGWFNQILSKKAASYQSAMRDIALDLFSAANTTYMGSEGAAEEAVPIVNPCMCLAGVSTPHDLWGALSSGSVLDGFLNRWLVFDTAERPTEFRMTDLDVNAPPVSLRKALQRFMDTKPSGNLSGVLAGAVCKAQWGVGAQHHLADLVQTKRLQVRDAERDGDRATEAVAVRFAEHVSKLSLLYAVSVNAVAPVITLEGLQWAEGVVSGCTAAMIAAVDGKIADNDQHASFLSCAT